MQSAVLMKLFYKDLLGNSTTEARIFARSIDKEMKRVWVLPFSLKVLALIMMIILNFYFVYGAVLYSREKTAKWQRQWLLVLVSNLFIDIMYTSVMEVFILRYVIPIAIANKASDIKDKLDTLIVTMSNTNTNKTNSSSKGNGNDDDDDGNSFSITNWFFVSNFIAKKRPDIPESAIVLSYGSTDPNDVSRKFNRLITITNKKQSNSNSNSNDNDDNTSKLIILNMIMEAVLFVIKCLTSLLLEVGVLPDFLQIMIVRLSQPLLLFIIIICGLQYPQLVLVVFIVICKLLLSSSSSSSLTLL
jgi:hypothetical protein